jgi:hypothetical protein
MRKAVSGMVIVTVISLILAIMALIIIWFFHEKIFAFFSETLLPAIQRMLCSVTNPLKSIFGSVVKWGTTILGGLIGCAGGIEGCIIGGSIGYGVGYGLSQSSSSVC